jgi:hypothetical protein
MKRWPQKKLTNKLNGIFSVIDINLKLVHNDYLASGRGVEK